MKDEKYRYRKGERVVITGLRHQPQAEVTIDQPRSSARVHVRELEGDRTNRHLHADNLTLWEEWVKRQPQPAEPPNAIVARFRAYLEEYLQSHTVPPKGKGHTKGVEAAYDYALAQAEARRYYDLGRGFTGRFLKAKRERKVGLNTPDPVASADEQLGVSLARTGARALKEHYRKQVRKHYQETGEAWTPEPASEEVVKPKLEIHVDIPAEVFAPDYTQAIHRWLESGHAPYPVIPQASFLKEVLGIDSNSLLAILQPYLNVGYRLYPTLAFGSILLMPPYLPSMGQQIKNLSLTELNQLMARISAEMGERLEKENPG